MRAAIVAIGIVVAVAAPARADDEPPETEPDRRPYRAHVMLADVALTAVFAGGLALAISSKDCDCEEMGSGYLMLLGGGGYLVVSPMLHREHRRSGRAVASAVLRVALPIAGGIVGAAIDDEGATTVGFVAAGAATAMVLDWTLLAW